MAEGDSIARLAARLHAATAGRTVRAGTFRHPRLALADLSGQRIEAWRPCGKHLVMRTSAGLTLHSHLRMSGSWSVLGPGKRLPRSVQARVLLRLDDDRTLAGIALPVLDLVRTRDEDRVVGHLGPDPRARLREAVATNPRQVTTGDPRRPHWVYGRARRPCYRCGTPVAFRPAGRTPHGRETWWCPGCQREEAGGSAAEPSRPREGTVVSTLVRSREACSHRREDEIP